MLKYQYILVATDLNGKSGAIIEKAKARIIEVKADD